MPETIEQKPRKKGSKVLTIILIILIILLIPLIIRGINPTFVINNYGEPVELPETGKLNELINDIWVNITGDSMTGNLELVDANLNINENSIVTASEEIESEELDVLDEGVDFDELSGQLGDDQIEEGAVDLDSTEVEGVLPTSQGGTGSTDFVEGEFIWYDGTQLTESGYDENSFLTSGTDNWVDESGDTMTGDLTMTGGNDIHLSSSNDILFGNTSLGESTSAVDSGAYNVGVFDEFVNSNATNVQDVLDDFDTAIVGVGVNYWVDGAPNDYIIPNSLYSSNVYLDTGNLGVGYDPSAITGGVAAFNGNVGIGTTNPQAKLSFGATTGEQIRLYDSTGGAVASYGLGIAPGDLQVYSANNGDISFRDGGYNGTVNMLITYEGYVGIGTTDPVALQHIKIGSPTYVGQIIQAASGQTANLSQWRNSSNQVFAKMDYSTGYANFEMRDNDLDVYYSMFANANRGYLGIGGANAFALELNHSASSNILMFSQSAEGETKELKIHGYRTGDSNRSLQIGVGIDAADTASFDGLSNYYFDGNVGIGTTGPSYTLDVASGAAIAGRFDGRVIGSDAVNTDEFVTLGQMTTGGSALWTRDSGNGYTYLTNTTDKVGIGTTAPSEKLELNGNLLLSGGTQNYTFTDRNTNLAIQSQTSATKFGLELFSKDGDGTDNIDFILYGMGTPSSIANRERLMIRYVLPNSFDIQSEAAGTGTVKPIQIYTGGNTGQIFLQTNGDVGIGTTAPEELLHIKSATAILKLEDTDSQANLWLYRNTTTPAAGTVLGRLSFLGKNDLGNESSYAAIDGVVDNDAAGAEEGRLLFKLADGSGSLVEKIRIMPSGNVGIGTTAPASLLSVGSSSQFQVNSSGNILNIGNVAHSIADSSGDLVITGNADLALDDDTLTSPVDLSVADTGLNGSLTQGIVDAINDVYDLAVGGSGGLWLDGGDYAYLNNTLASNIQTLEDSWLGIGSTSPRIIFDGDGGDISFMGTNVGIGTTAPDDFLEIEGNLGGTGIHVDSSSGAGVMIDRGANTNHWALELATAGTPNWQIGNMGTSENNLYFYDDDNGDTYPFAIEDNTLTQTLYLDSAGYIGLGTNNPDHEIHLYKATPRINLQRTNNNNAAYMSFENSGGTESWRIGNRAGTADNNLYIDRTNGGTNVMTFLYNNSYIGIGTTNPGTPLEVNGDVRGDNFLVDTSSVINDSVLTFNDASRYIWTISSGWGEYWNTSGNYVEWYGSGSVKMDLDLDTGDVNVVGSLAVSSYTSPGFALDVYGSSEGSNVARFWNTGGNDTYTYIGSSSNSGAGIHFEYPHLNIVNYENTSGDINFKVNTSTIAMTVEGDGQVGIGTTSPTAKLEVSGSNAHIKITNTDSGGGDFYIGNGSVDDAWLRLTTDGATSYADTAVNHLYFGAVNGATATHLCQNSNQLANCSSAAEYTPSQNVGDEEGTILSMSNISNPLSDKHTPFVSIKSTQPNDPNILGFTIKQELGADGQRKSADYVPLAIYGYFPVKVSTANGAIKRGDPITSSPYEGIGMKPSRSTKIIGYATEPFDEIVKTNCQFISSDTQAIWMNNDNQTCYRLPDGTILGKIQVMPAFSWYEPDSYLNKLDKIISDYDSGLLGGDLSTVSNLTITNSLTAGSITSQNATFVSIDVDDANIDNLTVNNLLTSSQIKAQIISAFDSQNVVIKLSESIGQTALEVQNVLGETVFSVDSTGKISLKSDANDSSTGTATLNPNELQIQIDTNAVTANSKVFVTPRSNNGDIPVLGVKSINDGYFTIEIDHARDTEVVFDWWIVGSISN